MIEQRVDGVGVGKIVPASDPHLPVDQNDCHGPSVARRLADSALHARPRACRALLILGVTAQKAPDARADSAVAE